MSEYNINAVRVAECVHVLRTSTHNRGKGRFPASARRIATGILNHREIKRLDKKSPDSPSLNEIFPEIKAARNPQGKNEQVRGWRTPVSTIPEILRTAS